MKLQWTMTLWPSGDKQIRLEYINDDSDDRKAVLNKTMANPFLSFTSSNWQDENIAKAYFLKKTYKLEWVRSRYNVNIRESCSRYKQKCHWNVFLNLRDQSRQTASFEKKIFKRGFFGKKRNLFGGKKQNLDRIVERLIFVDVDVGGGFLSTLLR